MDQRYKMNESWQNLIDLVVKPSTAFDRLKSNPKWVLAFILFLSLSIGLALANAPFINKLISLFKSNTDTRDAFLSYLITGIVAVLLWCVLLSVIFYVAARVFKIKSVLTYQHVFTAVVHKSLISTTIYLINIGLFPLFKQIDDIKRPVDMKLIPGLHMLAGDIENAHVLTFLSYLNPLSIWYIVVVTIAVTILAEVNKLNACIVALIIFLIRIGTEIMFLRMTIY